jgi:drug/metabolite transporter (DMT)-like permease
LWINPKYFFIAVCAGIAFSVDLYCWHKSIHSIGPGFATILGNFQVFILAGYAMYIFKEKPSLRFILSVAFAVSGLFMIAGLDIDDLTPAYKAGIVLGLITACAYSAYILLLTRLQCQKNGLSPIVNLMIASFTSAAILSVVAFSENQTIAIPDGTNLLLMLCYGGFSQVIAWILISRSLPLIKTSTAGLILLLQPALAFIWDIFIFGRRADFMSLFGAMLALTAIYLGTFNPSGNKKIL